MAKVLHLPVPARPEPPTAEVIGMAEARLDLKRRAWMQVAVDRAVDEVTTLLGGNAVLVEFWGVAEDRAAFWDLVQQRVAERLANHRGFSGEEATA